MKPEAQVSRYVTEFLKTVGFGFYSLEQGYRKERGGTRQTPGLPDMIAIGHGTCLMLELKAPGREKNLSDAQVFFQALCQANGVPHVVASSTQDVFDYLADIKVIEVTQ